MDTSLLSLGFLLLICLMILVFFQGSKLLILSQFELGVIDAVTCTTRHNRGIQLMMWFEFCLPILSLCPPVTSFGLCLVCATVAAMNVYRHRRDELRMSVSKTDPDARRLKIEGTVKLLCYFVGIILTIAVFARNRAPKIHYPIPERRREPEWKP
jgi:hypothetical protein